MGGFESFVPMIAGSAMSMAGQAAKNSAARDAASAQAEVQARQNQILLQRQAAEEQQQRDLLAKASATQRAKMGAVGMGGAGGSAAAILAGMSEDTAESIAASAQSAQLKLRTSSPASGSGQSLLDMATMGKSGLSVFQSFYDSMD